MKFKNLSFTESIFNQNLNANWLDVKHFKFSLHRCPFAGVH